jgi:hypothetical protein
MPRSAPITGDSIETTLGRLSLYRLSLTILLCIIYHLKILFSYFISGAPFKVPPNASEVIVSILIAIYKYRYLLYRYYNL